MALLCLSFPGERLFFGSHCDFYEAIFSSTLMNVLNTFRSWGVLECVNVEDGQDPDMGAHTLLRLTEVPGSPL
jgi:hypothetical protein